MYLGSGAEVEEVGTGPGPLTNSRAGLCLCTLEVSALGGLRWALPCALGGLASVPLILRHFFFHCPSLRLKCFIVDGMSQCSQQFFPGQGWIQTHKPPDVEEVPPWAGPTAGAQPALAWGRFTVGPTARPSSAGLHLHLNGGLCLDGWWRPE